MKKLLFAIAGAAAFAATATDYDVLSFETFDLTTYPDGVVANKLDTGAGGSGYKWVCDGDDASTVKTYDAEFRAPSITGPAQITGENTKYLNLDTNGSELKRRINDDGSAQAIGDALYIDTLVQFTPSESAPTDLDSDVKLAIWLGVDSEHNTTNLYVQGVQYATAEIDTPVATAYMITNVIPQPGTWYRLTVKAIPAALSKAGMVSAFTVAIDGTEAVASQGLLVDAALATAEGDVALGENGYICTEGDLALITANKVFGSRADLTQTGLTSVGFKGTGALDDFVVTTQAPEFGPAAIDFQLTWPAGLTASYKIGDGEPVALTDAGSQHIQVPEGSAVQLILQNADGATKTYNVASASSEANAIDASAATFGWPEYLGDPVDGAYEIDNLAELKLFQKGIATTTNELKLATAGETFKLTTDIALDEAWPGIGVQNGKDIYSTADFNAAAFQGTFDGQNHTISGFQMVGVAGNPKNNNEGLDYCGFFNSTYGATIQNLKIAYAGSLFAADTTASTKESGATFVGVAKNSTLRNLTTLAGTVSCSKGFGGIVGYLTSGTTVQNCTNNLNMTSLANNKCGGIAMIAQGGSAVTISNCQNNGTQTSGSKNSEFGAILGYVGLDVTIADCETTVGRFLKHQGNTVTLQGVNKGDPTVPAYHGAATPGLNFATVNGSTATFVADTALAAGNTYKVLGPSATATYEFAAAGSISFDTNLIQTVTFAITATQGLDAPTETTENGVVTFTVASQGVDIEPGQQDATVYTTSEEATAALANVTIVEPEDVSTNATITAEDKAAYDKLFAAKVVEVSGGYAIEVGLTAAAETTLQEQANDDAAEIVDAIDDGEVTFDTTPGLYYSIEYGTSLSLGNETDKVMATGKSLTLGMPAKPVGATSGFYKVKISITK